MNTRIETNPSNATIEPRVCSHALQALHASRARGESPSTPSSSTRLLLAVIAWLAAAATLAATGLLHLYPMSIAASALTVVTAWSLAYRRSPPIREALDAVPLRALVSVHLVRVGFGTLFLVELARGRMNEIFARRAGVGDVVVGLLALCLLLVPARHFRRLALLWNVVGLLDIGMAFVTAQWLVIVRHDASMLDAIARLPYSLLPTFVVPMVVLTHGLMWVRLRRLPA